MKRSFEVKESVADGRLRLNLIEQHDGYSQVTTMDPNSTRCSCALNWVRGECTTQEVFDLGRDAETTIDSEVGIPPGVDVQAAMREVRANLLR